MKHIGNKSIDILANKYAACTNYE